MKNLLLLAALIYGTGALAQDCKNYYFLQNNKTIEMSIYGKKGDVTAKQVYTVSDVKSSGGSTTATVNSEMFDKKGKSMAKSTSMMKCTGGALMVDMKMMMPQQQQQQIAQARIEEAFIEYPANMKAGDALKDAAISVDMNTSGMPGHLTMNLTERKIEAKESVTTTAGTWDCFKITYKGKINMKMAGIGIPMNVDGTEWYAPGFGVVKSESKHGGTAITSIK